MAILKFVQNSGAPVDYFYTFVAEYAGARLV